MIFVNLPVTDLDASMTFYKSIGFENNDGTSSSAFTLRGRNAKNRITTSFGFIGGGDHLERLISSIIFSGSR